MPRRIRKLLVANRSEIAIRVFRSGHRAGPADGGDLLARGPLRAAPLQGRRGLPGGQGRGAGARLPRHRGDRSRGPRVRGRRHPPGLRVPGREPGAGRRLRARGARLDRAAAHGDGASRQQGRGAGPGRARRRAGDAGDRGPPRRPRRGAAAGRRGGLPPDGEGELGRRRARHADGPRPGGAGGCRGGRPARGQGRLRQRRGLPGAPGRARLAHRGADPGRPAGQRRAPARARLHRAAAPPEGGGDRTLPAPRRRPCGTPSAMPPCA